MALPALIEKPQRDWLFKVTRELSKQPERDSCLLAYFFGTGCTTLQINRILLRDVLHKSGRLNDEFKVRGTDGTFYLTSKRLQAETIAYLDWRVKNKVGLGQHPDQFLGLDPDEALFISALGRGFSIVKKITRAGSESYSCDALNRHIKQLLSQAGNESPSILSGRRTFAVTLHRLGYDVAHIHFLLNNKTLETTQKLLTTDPVNMGQIAKNAY